MPNYEWVYVKIAQYKNVPFVLVILFIKLTIIYYKKMIHTFKTYKIDNRTARQRIRSDPTVPEIVNLAETIFQTS